MRISSKTGSTGPSSSVGGAKPVGGAFTSGPTAITGPIGAGDALSVSSTAHFIAVAEAQLAKVPDIRMDKVEALKAKLDSDDYHPAGEAVADGIVKDHTPPRRD